MELKTDAGGLECIAYAGERRGVRHAALQLISGNRPLRDARSRGKIVLAPSEPRARRANLGWRNRGFVNHTAIFYRTTARYAGQPVLPRVTLSKS
jgi:hypothetical protein